MKEENELDRMASASLTYRALFEEAGVELWGSPRKQSLPQSGHLEGSSVDQVLKDSRGTSLPCISVHSSPWPSCSYQGWSNPLSVGDVNGYCWCSLQAEGEGELLQHVLTVKPTLPSAERNLGHVQGRLVLRLKSARVARTLHCFDLPRLFSDSGAELDSL